MKISYSAPAKVIISGEHAVVYGKPALVSTIDLRLKFSIWKDVIRKTDRDILFISQKTKGYLKKEKISFTDNPFDYKIESNIPIGRGLGSSAALSVASAAAFLEFYTGQVFEKGIVNHLAYEIEKKFHKNPSGIDNTTSCFGSGNFRISKKIKEKLFLIDSGKPKETTGEMVNFVGTKDVKNILDEIEITTKEMENSIKKQNENLFKKCLIDNEKLLEKIGVVSDKTKKLLTDLSKFGSGKVTGAGGHKTGSGFILFFTENKNELLKYLKNNKIKHYQFTPDYQGLTRI